MPKRQALYLGDGVYAQLDDPGIGGIILTTGSHDLRAADNTIHLEPEVLESLIEYLKAQSILAK
jgi:hypothetical protein